MSQDNVKFVISLLLTLSQCYNRIVDMNYEQALTYIGSFMDYEKTAIPHASANYDLRRLEELMSYFDNPHLKTRTLHITGTKGKGSTAAMIATVLSTAGFTTGLYTSPHLLDLRERIRINEVSISESELLDILTRLQPKVAEVNKRATYGKITTFELLTAIAFIYYAERKVDFQVLEVGMGGTYDATNIIKNPEVCLITSISLDHTEVLGDTVAKIAIEKSGIIKPGCPVVTSPQPKEALQVIQDFCMKRQAKLVEVGKDINWRTEDFDMNSQSLLVSGRLDSYHLTIPLLGQHQLINATTAVAALEIMVEHGFNITKYHIQEGLAKVNWPGRFQIIGRHPLIVIDGAHNPNSTRNLRETIEQYLRIHKVILVIGTSMDKDYKGIVEEISPVVEKAIATQSKHPRALESNKIAAEFIEHHIPVETVTDVPAALSRAIILAGKNGTICITGSLFVVAEALALADKFGKC
jgi:dihydrofolate synthase / folylpolyglutamate synthase